MPTETELDLEEYRAPLIHRPPKYHTYDQKRAMVAPLSHKIKKRWDEEYVVAEIIANMHILGRWLSALMPNLYLEAGLYSSFMVTMSVSSKEIVADMSFPGDIDILVIPCDEDELILSKTLVVEVKILRGEKRRPAKSPNKYGHSQAASLLEHGFPYVGIGHVIVTDDLADTPNKEMFVATMGPGETITSLESIKVDIFEHDLANRSLGRLKNICGTTEIGYFVMSFDGKRVFEPLGRACISNRKYDLALLDSINHFYNENYQIFFEAPRYSPTDIEFWEGRIKTDPATITPWQACCSIFRNRDILSTETCAIQINDQLRIGYLYHTETDSFLFYSIA